MIAALLAHANAQHQTVCAVEPTVAECPDCRGYGEVQTGRDYFGNAETRTCGTCEGRGDVTATQLAWREEHMGDMP